MENSFFIFAPDEGYFYNTPKRYTGGKLRAELSEYLAKQDVGKMLWGTFGPGRENCFFSYLKSDGTPSYCIGDDVPKEFKDWLAEDPRYDEQIRVALGPKGSFFAWDSKRIRWHGIPDGLQDAVQGWLGPTGWTRGPPRIVTLGTNGSYFALSEYGASAWSVPESLKATSKAWKALKDEYAKDTFKYSDLEYVNFSSCNEDMFICVKKDLSFQANVPEPLDAFHKCFEDLLDEQTIRTWRIAREATKREQKAREVREKAERDAAMAQREKEEREAEELTLQYVLWQTAWEADLLKKKLLTTFPHLPIRVCICLEVSCKLRKVESGLLACQHDVERFLRASGSYDLTWLRKERLPWHPDRFGQRCDPDFRRELKKKATEMYAIFEALIENERPKEEGREEA